MEFNPKDISDKLKQAFIEGTRSPLKFAENFLIDPTLGTPFRATCPQKLILTSQKRDIWICVHRRAGKCVTADTLVIDPVTLKPTSIALASKFKKTLCFDFKLNQVVWAPCEWIESGTKKCLKLHLGSGAELNLSDDHPVFDWHRGWVNSSEIKVGDRILAPSAIKIFGTTTPLDYEAEKTVDETLAMNRVSDIVYSYTETALKKFLTDFFFAKGRIMHNSKQVTFMLWKKDLALDIRHLLLKFEIDSRVDEDGNLFIEDPIDRAVFLNMAGFEHPILQVRSPRRWEIVTEIKKTGIRPVYDLSVDHPDHNFIGNDVVLHNSYSMTVLALWHAVTQPGKKIVVFAPSSTQINEFFDVIDKWIVKNDFLTALQDPTGGNHKNPQKRTFVNGSSIQGYLMGMSGGLEGAKRGITADVVIVDEAQEFDQEDWKVIGPIMKGDKFRAPNIRCYIAGTINNPTNYYYEKIYKYNMHETEDRIFMPITQNAEYTPEEVETLRATTPPFQWSTEYLLEVAESDQAVFRKMDIDKCCEWDWEYDINMVNQNLVRFIGVDWDKVQAGTNIAVFQYDQGTGIVQMIYREEVARTEFTYTNAVERIIELYQAFQPELVITDQGQGEVQWELLQLESQKRNLGLAERLIKKAFNEKIEVPNPQTNDIEKKPLKPFLVGLLQQKMQGHYFRFPNHDETFYNQLVGYQVVKQTLQTTKYTTHNEHIIDCCLFAMYGIWWLYENQLEKAYGGDHNGFKTFNDSQFKPDEWAKETFWSQLDGERKNVPGNQLPRSTFDTWDKVDIDPSRFYNDDYGDRGGGW